MTRPLVWYKRYAQLRAEVERLKAKYDSAVSALGGSMPRVLEEIRTDVIARMVHESNWQEGLFLDQVRTQELAEASFGESIPIAGPHVDIATILDSHRRVVLRLKRENKTDEEIAAYNLATAYRALGWISTDFFYRLLAAFSRLGDEALAIDRKQHRLGKRGRNQLREVTAKIEELARRDSGELRDIGFTGGVTTTADLFESLRDLVNIADLEQPFKVEYMHFLHRLVLMGILPYRQCGVFRKGPVTVGDPQLLFPPASVVPTMMERYCQRFLEPQDDTVPDVVMWAAKVSHEFVRIHPYADGNGRISRLLMNFSLWGQFPPVYLKADPKGRHRYIRALRFANNGNLEALASLMCMSLIEVYRRLLAALGEHVD